MKKFKIECLFPFSGKSLHLLNQDFYSIDIYERTIRGRLSTYHQKEEFKVDWVRYPNLPNGHLVICSSEEDYSFDEALTFMAHHNGFALTRDNLFAGVNLLKEEILKKTEVPVKIAAFMAEKFLPKHLSYEDRKICPVLEIEKQDFELPLSAENSKGNYDWYWIDQIFDSGYKFAFFVPSFMCIS